MKKILLFLSVVVSVIAGCKKEDVAVTGVVLDRTTLKLAEGDSVFLVATVLPEDAAEKNVIWSCDAPDVVLVDSGKVRALKAGAAVVTVKTGDGERKASCAVTVREKVPSETVWTKLCDIGGGVQAPMLSMMLKGSYAATKAIISKVNIADLPTSGDAVKLDDEGLLFAYYDDGLILLHIVTAAEKIVMPANSAYLFSGLSEMKIIEGIGMLDFSNTVDMTSMFMGCQSLKSVDLSGFNTEKVTRMGSMFSNCYKLASLDLNSFKTGEVVDMSGMFRNCMSLSSIPFGWNFRTGSVWDFSYMFSGCSALTSLDFSLFDTGSVVDMEGMFNGCGLLSSLNLSGFKTDKVRDMDKMFFGCEKLGAIVLSEDFSMDAAEQKTSMFNSVASKSGGRLNVTGCPDSQMKNVKTAWTVSGKDAANLFFNGVSAIYEGVQLWEGGPYWATFNIGAVKPENYGNYFFWGDSTSGQGWNGRAFSVPFNRGGYCQDRYGWKLDGDIDPDCGYDPARKHWGGKWRLPTKEEFERLSGVGDMVAISWTENYDDTGVAGCIFTGKGAFSGNTVFLPFAGRGNESSLLNEGIYGYYWSSTYKDDSYAYYLDVFDGYAGSSLSEVRHFGFSVRPVKSPDK